jgi:hypothetical protein
MKNITIKQYTLLPDTLEYDAILEHLNPKNSFGGRQMDINTMPYANVKYCIRLLPKVDSWDGIRQLFTICYDVTEAQFWRTPIVEYFAARKFMLAEFERIIANETRLLATRTTDSHLWDMAGADKLKPFSDTLPLVQLGKLFGQYPFDLGRKPYSEIFNLLAQTKAQNEVENEYRKLQAP